MGAVAEARDELDRLRSQRDELLAEQDRLCVELAAKTAGAEAAATLAALQVQHNALLARSATLQRERDSLMNEVAGRKGQANILRRQVIGR